MCVHSFVHFLLIFIVFVCLCDRQADGLLERLLIRLQMSTNLQQKRYLAYCISDLNISEKGIKKITEMIR